MSGSGPSPRGRGSNQPLSPRGRGSNQPLSPRARGSSRGGAPTRGHGYIPGVVSEQPEPDREERDTGIALALARLDDQIERNAFDDDLVQQSVYRVILRCRPRDFQDRDGIVAYLDTLRQMHAQIREVIRAFQDAFVGLHRQNNAQHAHRFRSYLNDGLLRPWLVFKAFQLATQAMITKFDAITTAWRDAGGEVELEGAEADALRTSYHTYACLARDLGQLWRDGLATDAISRVHGLNPWRESWIAGGAALLVRLHCWRGPLARAYFVEGWEARMDQVGFEGELLHWNETALRMVFNVADPSNAFYGFGSVDAALFLS